VTFYAHTAGTNASYVVTTSGGGGGSIVVPSSFYAGTPVTTTTTYATTGAGGGSAIVYVGSAGEDPGESPDGGVREPRRPVPAAPADAAWLKVPL
jgi:hypothetical protein